MNTNDFLKVLCISVIILLIDITFITLNKNMWEKDIQDIQGSPLNIRFNFGLIAYILIITGTCVFVLFSNKKTIEEKMKLGFIWGVITYGIFDFTNLSLFSKYKLKTAITDTIWGGVMIAASVGLTELIFSLKF